MLRLVGIVIGIVRSFLLAYGTPKIDFFRKSKDTDLRGFRESSAEITPLEAGHFANREYWRRAAALG